jgi:recombinational DNA repair protein RecT
MSTAIATPTTAQPRQRSIIDAAEGALLASVSDEAARAAVARVALAVRGQRARAKPAQQADWDRCAPASYVAAIEWCARHGLYPGGSPPTVYLLPQAGELQARITHIGYATLAARVGIRLRTVAVHKADELRLDCGLVVMHDQDPDTEPASLDDLRGVIVCYAAAGQPETRLWVGMSAIRAARSASRSRGGPWETHPVQMARAAAIRAAFRRGDIIAEGLQLPEDPDEVAAQRDAERVERARGPGADLARARQLAAPVDAWEAEPERDPETGEVIPEGAGAR